MASGAMMDSFDHVGIVVKDVQATLESWQSKLGIGPWIVRDAGALRLAHASLGPVQFELLQPVEGKPSLWADFLNTHGEGLHHVSSRVADVDATAAKLEAEGGKIMIAIPGAMAYVDIGGPAASSWNCSKRLPRSLGHDSVIRQLRREWVG